MSHADSVATLVAAFERACSDAQVASTRAAAELALNNFSTRPDAIPVALAVTEHTTSSVARFHAAAAIRVFARDRWTALNRHQRYGHTSLRYWLVNNVVSKPSLLSFERKALLRTVAFLTRRAYLEESPSDRDTFFGLVCSTAASPDSTPYAATAATELLDLVLEEFLTPSLSASAPGIEREMILRTREQFASPTGHIIRIFQAAKSELGFLCSHERTSSPENSWEPRVASAVSAIFRILATDFNNTHLSSFTDTSHEPPGASGSPPETLEAVVINTFVDREWAPLMDEIPSLLHVCFILTGSQLSTYVADNESELLAKTMQIVVAIAAIKQASYPSRDVASAVLNTLLTCLNEQKWCSSQIGAVRLSYAEVWRRVSCAHGLSSVEKLGNNHIHVFTNDTCHEMDSAAVRLALSNRDEDVFSMDVTDMLLETWANMALQGDDGSPNTEHSLSGNIEQVVFHFIRMSLQSSGEAARVYSGQNPDLEEDYGFEDTSIDDSRLSVAAILTRFVLNKMVPAIAQSLLETAEKVFTWRDGNSANSRIPLHMYQEDVFFLVRLICAMLADEAKGECPAVPYQFLPPEVQGGVANGHGKAPLHARNLIATIMEVAKKESDLISRRSVQCDEASPRVGASLLDALSRICRTYLAPVDVSTSGQAFQAIGGDGFLESCTNCCFVKAMEGISRRGFEGDVAEAAAQLLLNLASGAKNYPNVRNSQAWQTLLQAGAAAYQTLPPNAVRDVGRSLTTVLGDVVADRLLLPAYNSLQGFMTSTEGTPDAADRAIAIVNLLRGAAKCDAIGVQTREALLLSLQAPGGIAASCAEGFGRTRPDVSLSLINLADDIVYTSLPIIDGPKARNLLKNCVTLVKLHTEIISSHLDEMSQDELCCDIEELISLLSHVMEEELDVDVGEGCYYGLSTLMPIMSEAVLALPAVSSSFFRFVTGLVSRYPEKLFLLPPDFCQRILHVIDVERTSIDVGSERRGLEAITALSVARVRSQKTESTYAVVDTALQGYLRSIFDGITSGSAHTTNMDAAADALLPLSHVKYPGSNSALEELCQVLLSSTDHNTEMRNAVQTLCLAASQAGIAHRYHGQQENATTPLQDRSLRLQSAKSFREAVVSFSAATRNCLLSVALGTNQ